MNHEELKKVLMQIIAKRLHFFSFRIDLLWKFGANQCIKDDLNYKSKFFTWYLKGCKYHNYDFIEE
jgi:hypothetical protein